MTARLHFRLRQLRHDLTSGMLLRPGLIALTIAVVGPLLVELERNGHMPGWSGGGWFFRDDPSSALAVLGAIAGSMMAVISIVYSVLLVALSLASVQFSPRILGSLIRDQISQRTLGVFLGTFVYCLLVMRSIHVEPAWTPTWAVAVGSLLGLACLVFLIYFLHHIATSIQVNHLVDRIALQTRDVIAEVYGPDPAEAPPPPADGLVVPASVDGYLQLVDHSGLASLARRADVTVHIVVQPGDYVSRGGALARIERRGPALDPGLVIACQESFDLGPVRTMQQDVAFGVRQLVDVALKALSMAVNDPSTAKTCIDRLGSMLADIADRHPRDRMLCEAGVARVVIPQPTFEELVDLAFMEIRQYARNDLAVSIRLLGALAVAARPATAEQRERLLAHAVLVREGLADRFLAPDRARFDLKYAAVLTVLDPPGSPSAHPAV